MQHYSISQVGDDEGMEFLRKAFPKAEADSLNFCLFSTSGVHGSYNSIEEEESGDEPCITFLVIRPRVVEMIYGNCEPCTAEDVGFLKMLRASSANAMLNVLRDSGWTND